MTAVVTGELLASVATNTTDTHIVLPDKLSSIKKAENFSSLKLKWNASEVRLRAEFVVCVLKCAIVCTTDCI